MLFAPCEFNGWKDTPVQIVNVSIPLSRQDGDAIVVPFSILNLNPNFLLKK
jgi:hypothetical protein